MDDGKEVACHLCFRDRVLQDWIKDNASGRGRCSWCGRKGCLIPLSQLSEPFREVASLYREAEGYRAFDDGDLISVLLDEDWGIFSEEIQISDLTQELATAILRADLSGKERYDHPDYDGLFCRQGSSLEREWDEKSYEVLVGEMPNLADLTAVGDQIAVGLTGRLSVAFEDMAASYGSDKTFYRARIHLERTRKTRFGISELGAPPSTAALAGRANRQGQSVLYVATNKSTALAEVRPWKGAAVGLAEVKMNRRINLVDLTRSEPFGSPFFVELLRWRTELSSLLYRLAQDMSAPVMPHEAEVLYKPTQLLALLIRANGYDGYIFPSAMGSGKNIVLFDCNVAEIDKVDYVRIKRTACFSELLSEHEDIYQDGPYDFALVS